MYRYCSVFVPLVILMILVLPTCAEDKRSLPVKGIDKEILTSESLRLYSLQPKIYEKEEGDQNVKLFHGYRILGELEVSEEKMLKLLQTGLRDSLSADIGIRAVCFRPHHGVVLQKGKTVICEMLICYQCQVAEVYDGDKYRGAISMKKGFEKEIDKILMRQKIPIED